MMFRKSRTYTSYGQVLYQGDIYELVNGYQLNTEMLEKFNEYFNLPKPRQGLRRKPDPEYKLIWSIENDLLYLVGIRKSVFIQNLEDYYEQEKEELDNNDTLMLELFGSTKILATWVKEMKLVSDHNQLFNRSVDDYDIYELEEINVTLNDAKIVKTEENDEVYTERWLKNYITEGGETNYTTLRVNDNSRLLRAIKKEYVEAEDMLFPVMLGYIDEMLKVGDKGDISLSIEDFETVLDEGDSAVYSEAKGQDIDDIVGSIIQTVTKEFLVPKGCLVQLVMNEEYDKDNLKSITDHIEYGLGYHKLPPSRKYIPYKNILLIGTQTDNTMDNDEFIIRVLISA